MILSESIINEIKASSKLAFDKVKDLEVLADKVLEKTGRTIGVTTLKRLLGFIDDDHKTNVYTLNTIAMYIGYKDWNEYLKSHDINSIWGYEDETIYMKDIDTGRQMVVKYLNRIVTLQVVEYKGEKALKVIKAINSSLEPGDVLLIYSIQKGQALCAEKVIRNENIGNYKTKGDVFSIEMI